MSQAKEICDKIDMRIKDLDNNWQNMSNENTIKAQARKKELTCLKETIEEMFSGDIK